MIDLDEAAGPPGSTVRHLLAHTSGLPFEGAGARSRNPGAAGSTRTRRFAYSPSTSLLAPRCRLPSTSARRSASRSRSASTRRVILVPECTRRSKTSSRSVASCERPRLVAPETRDEMVAVQFPGLAGVLPDHGRFDPLDWGLGVQLNTSPPSWMGTRTSARAFGHFGGTGTLPLGRSGCPGGLCRADDARVRRLGEGGVAAFVGRGARRSSASP